MDGKEFSDETPTSKIISYWRIEFHNRSLNKILLDLAIKYVKERSNLQPTYAQFTSFALKRKYDYTIKRLLGLYEMNDEEVMKCKADMEELTEALRLIERAKSDTYFRNFGLKKK
jgi:hypothetical protein